MMDTAKLELKIIPTVVALMTIMLMLLTSLVLPETTFPLTVRLATAGLWVAFGAAVALMGVWQFHRVQTTLRPTPENTTTLVINGIYRHTRNPMYLGMACALVGLVCFLGSAWQLLWVIAFVVYITRFQILPEERVLAKKFAAEFGEYRQKVRRWV